MEGYAVNKYGDCVYRSDTGPCLAGCLIKDEFYEEEMEQNEITNISIFTNEILIQNDINPKHIDFIAECQKAHDDMVKYDIPFDRRYLHRVVNDIYLRYMKRVANDN